MSPLSGIHTLSGVPKAGLTDRRVAAWVPFLVWVCAWAAVDPSAAGLKEALRWAGFCGVLTAAAAASSREADVRRLAGTVAVLAAVVSALGVLQAALGAPIAERAGAALFFGHPNPFGAFANLGLFAAVALASTARDRARERFWLLVAAVCAAGVLGSQSRGALAAAGAGTALLAAAGNRRLAARVASALLAVCALAAVLAPGAVRRRVASGIENRTAYYHLAVDLLGRDVERRPWWEPQIERPLSARKVLFGAGPEAVRHATTSRERDGQDFLGDMHSLYLEVGVSFGLVGLLLFLGAAAASIRGADWPMVLPFTVWMINGVFGFFAVHGIQLAAALLLGAALGARRSPRPEAVAC